MPSGKHDCRIVMIIILKRNVKSTAFRYSTAREKPSKILTSYTNIRLVMMITMIKKMVMVFEAVQMRCSQIKLKKTTRYTVIRRSTTTLIKKKTTLKWGWVIQSNLTITKTVLTITQITLTVLTMILLQVVLIMAWVPVPHHST